MESPTSEFDVPNESWEFPVAQPSNQSCHCWANQEIWKGRLVKFNFVKDWSIPYHPCIICLQYMDCLGMFKSVGNPHAGGWVVISKHTLTHIPRVITSKRACCWLTLCSHVFTCFYLHASIISYTVVFDNKCKSQLPHGSNMIKYDMIKYSEDLL